MLGFLAKVAAVIAAGGPVFLLLIGLVVTALGIWGTYEAVSSVSVGVADTVSRYATSLRDLVNSLLEQTGRTQPNIYWFLFNVAAIDKFLEYAAISLSVIVSVITALSGIFLTLSTSAIAVWAYRKARLFANIITGSGVHE